MKYANEVRQRSTQTEYANWTSWRKVIFWLVKKVIRPADDIKNKRSYDSLIILIFKGKVPFNSKKGSTCSKNVRHRPKTYEKVLKKFRSYTSELKNNLRDKLRRVSWQVSWHGTFLDIAVKWGYRKYATRVPEAVSYEFYECCLF